MFRLSPIANHHFPLCTHAFLIKTHLMMLSSCRRAVSANDGRCLRQFWTHLSVCDSCKCHFNVLYKISSGFFPPTQRHLQTSPNYTLDFVMTFKDNILLYSTKILFDFLITFSSRSAKLIIKWLM